MRATALQRRTTPRRRAAPRRRHDPGYTGETRELARVLRAAWIADPEPCAVCGSTLRVQGHHVAEKQWIKALARAFEYSVERLLRALWDTRNRLWVCERCHMGHHAFEGGRRISRTLVLTPALVAFLDEHVLWARFDRAYPEGS